MKKTTILLLSAFIGLSPALKAQQPQPERKLHPVKNMQLLPEKPDLAAEERNKADWLWGKFVHYDYVDGEWQPANEQTRTFDHNDRVKSIIKHTFDHGDFAPYTRETYEYDENGFSTRFFNEASNDGVNYIPTLQSTYEADEIFTQTPIAQNVRSWDAENNEWVEVEAYNMWRDVQRDEEGRIVASLCYAGVKPDKTEHALCHKITYLEDYIAPHEVHIYSGYEDLEQRASTVLSNVTWHAVDGNYIWINSNINYPFFDSNNASVSKGNKPLYFETMSLVDGEYALTGIKQYHYQENGSYQSTLQVYNATVSIAYDVIDNNGSYTLSQLIHYNNGDEDGSLVKSTYDEYKNRLSYKEYGDNWVLHSGQRYTNTYEDGMLISVETERCGSDEVYSPYSRTVFSDYQAPQLAINEAAAPEFDVIFSDNRLEMNLPAGTAYAIHDTQGRTVTAGAEAPVTLSMNGYAPGVYILTLTTTDGRKAEYKLIAR